MGLTSSSNFKIASRGSKTAGRLSDAFRAFSQGSNNEIEIFKYIRDKIIYSYLINSRSKLIRIKVPDKIGEALHSLYLVPPDDLIESLDFSGNRYLSAGILNYPEESSTEMSLEFSNVSLWTDDELMNTPLDND